MKIYLLLPAIKMLAKLNTLQDAEYFLYWNYSLAGEKKKKKKKSPYTFNCTWFVFFHQITQVFCHQVGRGVPQKIYVNVVGGLNARFSQNFQASQECGGGSKQGNKAFHPKSLKPLIQFILT